MQVSSKRSCDTSKLSVLISSRSLPPYEDLPRVDALAPPPAPPPAEPLAPACVDAPVFVDVLVAVPVSVVVSLCQNKNNASV